MTHFGLALSGGGFRGTLYHLGVVRFLRDAGLLRAVTHITSVSGGSILGAHLVLDWDRYCGSDEDFDDVSAEILRYTQLDVRNRIARRFPFASALNTLRRLLRLGNSRQLTRAGLLESHYTKFLYGDVPLSDLPAQPELHILSTNLSEGCLCSFSRNGLLLQRRDKDQQYRFEHIGIGLATLPMAVAASSAFPGFFPPLELDGWELGADKGEFDRQAFTDGGVYDNLGLRMFRCFEQSRVQGAAPVGLEDFQSILVSDAGGKFKVSADGRAGGLIKTALRATDILMDRVWQLELEAFENTPGAIACPIRDVVEPSQDRHAIHPEFQRQAVRIRTDLDRFSDLEITTLVKHGYCVARKACRDAGLKISDAAQDSPAWEPKLGNDALRGHHRQRVTSRLELETARDLRRSSRRRIWSTLLSYRDWPSYVWVPLVLTLVCTFPYLLYESRQRAHAQQMVLAAVAETSPLYRTIVALLADRPADPPGTVEYTEVASLEPIQSGGIELLTDARVYDLRRWNSGSEESRALLYNRIRLRRTESNASSSHFRVQLQTLDAELAFHCANESLQPRFSRMRQSGGDFAWELDLDLRNYPIGEDVDIHFDSALPSDKLEDNADAAGFRFFVAANTGLTQVWMLMPTDRGHRQFTVVRYPFGKPELAETVSTDAQVDLPIGSIATFSMLNPTAEYQYECRWKWEQ